MIKQTNKDKNTGKHSSHKLMWSTPIGYFSNENTTLSAMHAQWSTMTRTLFFSSLFHALYTSSLALTLMLFWRCRWSRFLCLVKVVWVLPQLAYHNCYKDEYLTCFESWLLQLVLMDLESQTFSMVSKWVVDNDYVVFICCIVVVGKLLICMPFGF